VNRLIRRLWRNYSLSIVLASMFLVSWLVQTWAGWHRFAAEQHAHGEDAQILGASGYVWEWASATMENWQSEFLQLLTFVVLTAFFIHRGSHESRDGDDEMRATLSRIESRVGHLEELMTRPSNGGDDRSTSDRRHAPTTERRSHESIAGPSGPGER
jgi:hypothetical protein